MSESKANNHAKEMARAYKAEHGKYPTRSQLVKLSEHSAIIVSRALGEIGIEDKKGQKEVNLTKKQENLIEAKIRLLTNELKSSYEDSIKKKVEEALSWRDAKDAELIEQANALLARNIGPGRKPFSALEYVSIMRALHPDTSTPENRMEAFKLVNNKKLLLREEGKIELRGRRIPRTKEEWEAAKIAASEARKLKVGE